MLLDSLDGRTTMVEVVVTDNSGVDLIKVYISFAKNINQILLKLGIRAYGRPGAERG